MYDTEQSYEDFERESKEKTGFFCEDYEEIRSVLCGYDANDGVFKLGGYPDNIRNSVSAYYGDDHVQLLQIPPYGADSVGFMPGDGVIIYFSIKMTA